MKKITTLLFSFVQITLSMAQYCNQLDPGFGVNGKATGMSINNDWISAGSTLVQPDNKIIQIGSTSNNSGIHVVRYTNDGHIDNTFGVNGKATFNLGFSYYFYVSFGAFQSDGKIVVVGRLYSTANYYWDIVLVRFNSDGSLDNSFGGAGYVITSGSYHDEGNGLAIQPDGKIVVAGFTSTNCFSDCLGRQFCLPTFSLLRYSSDGTLDATFGQSGKTVAAGDSLNGGRAVRVIIFPNGQILAVGEMVRYYCDDYYGGQYYSSGLLIAKFDDQGRIDTSFGDNGIIKDDSVMSTVAGAALQPDGKIVVTGSSYQGGNVTKRYHSDGKPDNSFISERLSGNVSAITINNDGKIILGGLIYRNNIPNLLVARLNSNGSPDNSFSGDGQWYLPNNSPDSSSSVTGLAVQQGHIIAGGVTQFYNSINGTYRSDLFVTRLKDSIDDINVSVDRSGPLYPCEGQNVVLAIHHQSGTFQWYKDDQLIIGATDSIINATSSGAYSVKVINSGKCGESADVPVFFNSLPITVIPHSSLNICNGDSVKLVSSETGILQWFRNGFEIYGATDTAYMAKAEGNYNVAVKNSKGCGVSSSVYVYINPYAPVITWNLNNLWTTTGYYSYQWYRDGIAIRGANGDNYHPTDTGSYKVVIEDYGCNNTSNEIYLDCNYANVQVPVIYWDGERLNTSPGFSGYQWYLDGNAISAADTSFLQTAEFGSYRVRITGNFNCTNTSDEFVFSCNVAAPSKPPVNWNSSQFSTLTGYSGYQWYRNDTAISGATGNTYTPAATQFGFYKVAVTNDLNCSSTSDPKPYFITASNDLILADASLRYYPNPVSNTLFIDVTMQSNRKIVSTLYDLSGKRVRQQSLKQGRNQLQLEHLSSGMYQLEVQYGVERKVVKVVVVR